MGKCGLVYQGKPFGFKQEPAMGVFQGGHAMIWYESSNDFLKSVFFCLCLPFIIAGEL